MSDGEGRIVGRQEFAYSAGRQSDLRVSLNRMVINTGYSDEGPAARTPGPLGGDPATELRARLANDNVSDAGLVETGGRTVRRLVSETSGPTRPMRRVTYDLDAETFAPVRGVLRVGFPASARSPMVLKSTFIVDRYARLPINAQTAKLLTIATNPQTKVTVLTPEARSRRLRESTKDCSRTAKDNLTCPLPPTQLP